MTTIDTDTDEMPLTVDDDKTADLDTERMDLRGLVMSGGKPYILIVVEDSETGGVQLTTGGFDEGLDLALVLQELALLVADQ